MLPSFLLCFIGFSAGIVTSGGVAGLLTSLLVIPRYTAITKTHAYISIYENTVLLGTVLGNLFYLFRPEFIISKFFLIPIGLFSGFFLGSWVMALAEMAKVFPVFFRRINFSFGISAVIFSLSIGKTLGSLLYYFLKWA